ncbi:MAG: hypothetical protein J5817_04800 [Treponema sp.]|nr:hypothetical protein [Treponema sp.]
MFVFLLSYFVTFIAIYILLNVIYNIRFFVFLIFFYYFRIDAGVFLSVAVFSLAIALVFFVLFLENVKLQSILNFTLSRKEKLALFFMPLYIFFAAEIFMLLFFLLRLFPKMQASDLLDSIFIFKTGTVIFTSVMLEGFYIMYKKSSALN